MVLLPREAPWATYGGAGYWIRHGVGNRDWWFTGWQVQQKICEGLTIAGEIYHETPQEIGGSSDTVLNLGGILDLVELSHLLVSAGDTVQGPDAFKACLELPFTFGPEEWCEGCPARTSS